MFSSPTSLGHVNCGSMYISSAAKLTGGGGGGGGGLDGLGIVLNLCTHKCLVPPQPRLSSSAYESSTV